VSLENICFSKLSCRKALKIQRDSKRWTQFRTSVFPELYMVCEWST